MPVITNVTTVAANSTATPLVGTQYEFLPFDAHIAFGIVADATGVQATVYSGSDLLQQEGPVIIRAAGAFPIDDQDFYLTDVVAAGERLSVQLRNTTGAGIATRTVVKITPL